MLPGFDCVLTREAKCRECMKVESCEISRFGLRTFNGLKVEASRSRPGTVLSDGVPCFETGFTRALRRTYPVF